MSEPTITTTAADIGTVSGYVLIPTPDFRWKESTFTCCPPILQQLHIFRETGRYQWKAVPTVPHDTPDEPI